MKLRHGILVLAVGCMMFAVGSCSATAKSNSEVIVVTPEGEVEEPTQEEAERLYWQTFEEKLTFEVQNGTKSFDAGFIAQRTAEKAAYQYYPNFKVIAPSDQFEKANEIIMEVYANEVK